ncbi:MAG TPA: hypothetical protein VIW70_13670 [Rubrivivax sp.]
MQRSILLFSHEGLVPQDFDVMTSALAPYRTRPARGLPERRALYDQRATDFAMARTRSGCKVVEQNFLRLEQPEPRTPHCGAAAAACSRNSSTVIRFAVHTIGNYLLSRRTTMPASVLLCVRVTRYLGGALIGLSLAGCGAEVMGGAATVGAMQATQAKQAQQQQAKVEDGLKAAHEAGAARAASSPD